MPIVVIHVALIALKYHTFDIFKETDKDLPLLELELDIEQFNEVLEDIDPKQQESIKSFLASSDLVEWLRTALPGKYEIVLEYEEKIKKYIKYYVGFCILESHILEDIIWSFSFYIFVNFIEKLLDQFFFCLDYRRYKRSENLC